MKAHEASRIKRSSCGRCRGHIQLRWHEIGDKLALELVELVLPFLPAHAIAPADVEALEKGFLGVEIGVELYVAADELQDRFPVGVVVDGADLAVAFDVHERSAEATVLQKQREAL